MLIKYIGTGHTLFSDIQVATNQDNNKYVLFAIIGIHSKPKLETLTKGNDQFRPQQC